MPSPLADRLRPSSLDEVVGQKHILAPGAVLRRIIDSADIPNLIFFGPSGVGKTTVARIIAQNTGKKLCKLNGTTASTADLRAVVGERDTIDGRGGVILYLDEIQYLNKKQQQTLLEFIEDGSVTLIASTTENPYFYVYNAILSRSTVFEFRPVEPDEVVKAVIRAFDMLAAESGERYDMEESIPELIARSCGGDVRKSVNAVELCWIAAERGENGRRVLPEQVREVSQRSNMRYDRNGDEHYDILSAFQKSIRGSDENAGLHYLARLLEAGDLLSACRRLLVIASEDIGLAYPMAVVIVKACVDSALQLGLPEAQMPLSQAVVLLATAPKSNSANAALGKAWQDIRENGTGQIPDSLRDGHYQGAKKLGHAVGYQYSHNFPGHYVRQQYLPDQFSDRIYYEFDDNKTEQAAKAYREKLLKLVEENRREDAK